MAKASMTARLAWGAIPLAMLAAALYLVIFNGLLNADDSPTVWDFEGDDALAGWTPVHATLDLVPSVDGGTEAALTLNQRFAHAPAPARSRDRARTYLHARWRVRIENRRC